MKRYNSYIIAIVSLVAMLASSCGVNYVDVSERPDNPDVPDVPGTVNGYMRDYPVWGTVTDRSGNPLPGVRAVSGECVDITNEAGFFYLEQIDDNANRPIVRFEKDGYFPVVRSCYIENFTNYGWQVAMASRHGESTISDRFSSSDAYSLRVGGLSVDLPADGYVVAATGRKYRGIVEAEVFYLSPEAENFTDLMPGGDLAAIDVSSRPQVLLSYGMVNVELSDDNGNRLQIADGENATLSFPTPATMASDAPSSIPLWSFDESTGLWKEEGMARRDGSGNYVGEVEHFTWWNIDYPGDEAWIEGYVTNESHEPLSGIKIIFGNQVYTVTDATGYYKKRVMSNTRFDVWIPSEEYANYSPEYKKEEGPIASYSTKRHDIELPNKYYLKGRVVDEHGNPFVTSYDINVAGLRSNWKNTDNNGEFMYYFTPGYVGPASVSVLTRNGVGESYEFYVPGNDNVYLEIKLGSGTVVPDVPDIIANCGGGEIKYLNVNRPTASVLGGVVIEDSWMTVISDLGMIDDSDNLFMLQIPEFSPSQNEYTNFVFVAIDGRKVVQCQGGRLTITQDGDTYRYSLSGEGYFAEMDDDGDLTGATPADISVNNVDMPHFMTIERHENYTPKDPFKSFVPQLSTPAPVAMVVTKCEKLGTGGFLYYNGDFSDFDNLIAQAEKTGYSQKAYDKEQDYAEAYYADGNSIIMIDADMDSQKITSSSWKNVPMFDLGFNEDDGEAYESQISVTMFSGGTYPWDFLWDESDISQRSDAAKSRDMMKDIRHRSYRTLQHFYSVSSKEFGAR